MTEPMLPISVLIPTRKMNHYIPGLLKNLDTQITEGDEVLILFDGTEIPTDLVRLIGSYPYVQAFATARAQGVSRARNFLAAKAKCDILRFQDCDDLLAPYSLEAARRSIAKLTEWHLLVGGQFLYAERAFNRVGINPLNMQYSHALLRTNPLLVNMCYFHRPSFMHAGGFDPKISFQEDWDLWLRYLKLWGEKGFTRVPDIFGVYNIVQEERDAKKSQRKLTVDGLPVREYFFRKNGFEIPPDSD